MKLSLPDVTLLMVDTRCHELARLAVLDCMDQVAFGKVLICSDIDFEIPSTEYRQIVDWPTKDAAQEFLWYDIPSMIETSHFLFCEWDAWVLDWRHWTDDFLSYDFIGAPWLYADHNVGNGGFSLNSTRRARHVASNPARFQVKHPFIWDVQLGRDYREMLEQDGFRFAPLEIARKFSFETRHDNFDTFGFHAMYNWPMVISGNKLRERVRVARQTTHIVKTQREHLERLPACK